MNGRLSLSDHTHIADDNHLEGDAMTTLQSMKVILTENFGLEPESLSRDANLEALDIDSLSMIEILFAVEDEFKVTIPSEPAAWRDQIQTMGDLVDYVDRLVIAQSAGRAGKVLTL